jgi:energy-coupling factor transporter ATP-binding protein EcfA2
MSKAKQTSIFTDAGDEVPLFSKDLDFFLGRSIMLFGSSNSGKSTIIKDLLYTLNPHIPNILVCCPTNKLNQSYTGIVPNQFIHDDVDEAVISKILKRQSQVVKIYNSANDFDTVETIYSKIDRPNHSTLMAMENVYRKCMQQCDSQSSLIITNEHKKKTMKWMQDQIASVKSTLVTKSTALSDYEKMVAQHIKINPEFMLIIDDAAFSAKVWCKYHAIQELFFNGRHYHITFMIAFQDDKSLDSSLRKNAFINIFTTEKVSNAYFERSANNFTRQEKNKMLAIASAIFSPPTQKSSLAKYRKLIYMKDFSPSSYHYTAALTPSFSFGSKVLMQYCDKIKKKEDDVDMSEFMEFF